MLKRLAFALLPALAFAAPAQAADPIMPLSSVRSGMHCTGLTVVRGTTVSQFDVEVLDVITGDPAESGPRILIRVSGPAVDASGIAAGFSGSPVMCPDSGGTMRNAGAISEGVGAYGNDVGLATPIEEMLGERPAAARSARRDPRLLRSGRPLAVPLSVSGLSPRPRALLARAARRAGRPVLAAPAGPLGGYPAQELRPGSSVTAALASGDLGLGAVGTVTYRDGDTVFAFGHPLDAAGPRSLFLQDSYVFGVIANPLTIPDLGTGSYKLAGASGHTLGTLTNDALAAVVGKLGAPPPSIALHAAAHERRGGRQAFVDTDLADERALDLGAGLSLIAPLALGQTIDEVVRSTEPATFTTCVRFRAAELRPFGYCNAYFDSFVALSDLEEASGLVESYDLSPLSLTSLSVSTQLRRGVKSAELLSGRAPRRVRPGRRARVVLTLGYPHRGRKRLTVRVPVPRGISRGRHVLTLKGSGQSSSSALDDITSELETILLGGGGDKPPAPPRSRSALVRRVRALHHREGILARFDKRSRRLVRASSRTQFTGRVRVPVRVSRR
jgi:hypothetical protein